MALVRILTIGDIVGRPGRQVVHDKVPELVRQHRIDLVVANAENIAGGSGITPKLFHDVRSYGVDVVTLGDHAYRRLDITPILKSSERIIRPANLSARAAGRLFTVVKTNSGVEVAICTVLGRIFVNLPADDPFATVDHIFEQLPRSLKVRLVEIHAEATSEKVAMGHWLDGRASLVFGTHTHVPTADARVLAGGTAYISDLGMTGPYDSVLGRRKDRVVQYMTTNMPQAFDVATGDVRLCGALVEIDADTGKAVSIQRIEVTGDSSGPGFDEDDARSRLPRNQENGA